MTPLLKPIAEAIEHCCDVLQKLGTVRGRVFRYFKGPRASTDPDHPDVIWEGEFADQESFQKYEEIAGKNAEFRSVQQHMGTLVRKTERRYWESQ